MRILGITVPNEKRLEIGLTCLYGVGIPSARKILDQVGIDRGKKAKDLTSEEENNIRAVVEKILIEGNLKREICRKHKKIEGYQKLPGRSSSEKIAGSGTTDKNKFSNGSG